MVISTHHLEGLGKVGPPMSARAGKVREGPKGREVSWSVYSRYSLQNASSDCKPKEGLAQKAARRPAPTQVPTGQEKPHLSLNDTRRSKPADQTPPANVSQQGKHISGLAESCQLHPRVRILRTVSSWLLNIRTLDPLVLGHNAMPCPKVPTMSPAQINCREP